MEVDQYDYRDKLLDILTNISNASFIAFDLEMSGIKKSTEQQRETRRKGPKPTLEQSYQDIREAAESFQILQVGICCVEEDREKGFYLARPYNFNLSPLETDTNFPRFEMDRQLQFSGSACKFLQTVQFDFGKVFRSGVTYLSRFEEVDIRKSKLPGQAQSSNNIDLKPGDPKLDFYNFVKKEVVRWKESPKSDSFLNISHPNGAHLDLNGLQRRLIYQLIDNEFPEYQAKNGDKKGSWMQIVEVDHEAKAQKTAEDLEKFSAKLEIQIGLRWVIEALVNGEIDAIPAKWFYRYDSHDPKYQENDRKVVDDKLRNLKRKLKEKKHIIVGHNLFMDLGFLYSSFIGPLPPNVAGFQQAIHNILPFVLDTKYIASEGQESMSSQPKLKDLLKEYRKLDTPKIYLHEEHTTYNGIEKEHEAGYDSWMTAELFIKLSLSLYNQADFQDTASDYDTASGSPPNTDAEDLIDLSDNPDSSLGNPANWHGAQMQVTYLYSDPGTCSSEPSPTKPKRSVTQFPDNRSLATENPFSLLDQIAEDESDVQESPPKAIAQRHRTTGKGLTDNGNNLWNNIPTRRKKIATEETPGQKKTRSIKKWLPSMDNPFWELYANKLRVNAAESGFCNLGST